MKMTWSPDAIAALHARFGADTAEFRLVYDIEGCGCGVNGVPALWAVDAAQPGDIRVDSGPLPLWIDPQQQVFFEDSLRISYAPERNAFKLSSDNQTYTSHLLIEDRRIVSSRL